MDRKYFSTPVHRLLSHECLCRLRRVHVSPISTTHHLCFLQKQRASAVPRPPGETQSQHQHQHHSLLVASILSRASLSAHARVRQVLRRTPVIPYPSSSSAWQGGARLPCVIYPPINTPIVHNDKSGGFGASTISLDHHGVLCAVCPITRHRAKHQQNSDHHT